MANKLEIVMIAVTALAVIVSIVMSFINGKEARKIREKHINEFLERREERKKPPRKAL